MARKRKPKHSENYTTPESAALMLEGQAKLLRKSQAMAAEGPQAHLVALDLTIRYWYVDEGAPVATPTTNLTPEGTDG